ncbi:MAG: tRNA threonylcarbamoyladenosine dehydratase [Clostridia bacterium]|nr:tRNA threonylcarbamoyladenosine dehydratase [Clostridia bacterium]
MNEQHSRTEMMLGADGVKRLINSRVIVFGVGGVGGYAVEALARAGVGHIELVDSDQVSLSNINRQIIATHDTVGKYKTEAMRDRILSINPECTVVCHNIFFDENCGDVFDFSCFDYVIDAIDSLSAKIELIASAHSAGTKIISAMGAGNKLDPTLFEVSDISKTTVCPLARAVRIALRKRGINHLKVVYSKEPPVITPEVSDGVKKRVPGSISFVPSVMGLIIAGEVVKDIASTQAT